MVNNSANIASKISSINNKMNTLLDFYVDRNILHTSIEAGGKLPSATNRPRNNKVVLNSFDKSDRKIKILPSKIAAIRESQ